MNENFKNDPKLNIGLVQINNSFSGQIRCFFLAIFPRPPLSISRIDSVLEPPEMGILKPY